MPQRQEVHAGAESDPPRGGGAHRESLERVRDRLRVGDVVGCPQRREAELLDPRRERRQLGRGTDSFERDTEFHVSPLEARPRSVVPEARGSSR